MKRTEGPTPRIVFLVERYPVYTETFVDREIQVLRHAGVDVSVFCCSIDSTVNSDLSPHLTVTFLRTRASSIFRAFIRSPRRFLKCLVIGVECVRENCRRTGLFLKALCLAGECSRQLDSRIPNQMVYAHFLNRPALVATFVSLLSGIPYCVSAHARDVFVPTLPLSILTQYAERIHICSRTAMLVLEHSLAGKCRDRLHLLYHGVDLSQFPFRAPSPTPLHRRLRLITIARLVPKKGIRCLLDAAALLVARGWAIHFRLLGEGPYQELVTQYPRPPRLEIEQLSRVGHDHVSRLFEDRDIFVLGSCVGKDGDRDGIPNAILEAMASGVLVVASDGGGVHEVVKDGETGFLLPPDDPDAFATAIEHAAVTWDGRIQRQARSLIEAEFDARHWEKALCDSLFSVIDTHGG